MRTAIAIGIGALPREVFDLSRDVSRWPALLPHYLYVTIQSRDVGRVRVTMSAVRRFGPVAIPVTWQSDNWTDDSDPHDLRLRFVHVAGPTRGMDVTWHIEPSPQGSRVTIVHDFSRPLPIVGSELFPALIDRVFVRAIAGKTLSTFKRLAEKSA